MAQIAMQLVTIITPDNKQPNQVIFFANYEKISFTIDVLHVGVSADAF